ncbi:uncharacterized protein MELLADRAFT_70531 [Melampsora larici-populina 98AG31]|uniref:Uncharacterized protein n=1 Tax=Melampsora larici-populina (strain 98AG31 / pathotype 3-4-7) TaxID=747676 RepID=F4R4M2_MELLP|nr:uncharacterized protein MELLADRAFT_70531 [Melampsora larici-populina 98AG31]EGG12973.1 hypothetical protein MELLADRAFT_70531 [Melampsora larici-populina 98AG31]
MFLDDPGALISEFLPDDSFRFELPRLINLEITSTSAIRFSRAFENSKSLSWLSLGFPPHYQGLKGLIEDQLWPDLKKLEITDYASSFREEVEGLEVLCQRYAIEIVFNADLGDDEDIG